MNTEELKLKAIDNINYFLNSEESKSIPRMVPSMMVNLYGDISKNSEEFKKNIINEHEQYEEIYADVVTSLDNPNCSCRGRFANFIEENQEKALESYKKIINQTTEDQKELLEQALLKQEEMHSNLKKETEKNKEKEQAAQASVKLIRPSENKNQDETSANSNFTSTYLEGNVIEIEDTPESYGNLIRNLRMGGEHYNGLTVVPKSNNKIWVYFY